MPVRMQFKLIYQFDGLCGMQLADHRSAFIQETRINHIGVRSIETCRECGGAVRIIACIDDPVVIEKILTHLDEKGASAEASRRPRCRAPPQAGLFD